MLRHSHSPLILLLIELSMSSNNYDTSHYDIFSSAPSLSGSNVCRLSIHCYYVCRRDVVEWVEGFKGGLMSFILNAYFRRILIDCNINSRQTLAVTLLMCISEVTDSRFCLDTGFLA